MNSKNKKILITSALPYVNNVPHLGNIIGCVLSADVFSRYCKASGKDVIYICGTDEYGTATEIKALEEGVSPREVCDKYNKIHKDIYDWFGIKFDYFGRTSTEAHTKITQEIFTKLYKNGYIVESEVEQPYDEKADLFLADRYIEGTCPFCSSNQARADQCDKCGKLLTFQELISPVSKVSKTKPVIRKTKHLFINLPELEQEVAEWIEKTSKTGFWSENSANIAKAWLRDGLKKRAITRDLKWGVKVPLAGYEHKVFYVWFDAPIGYISITAAYTPEWRNWWLNPKEVELYQFMGKDNVPFHTVIFPSTLIGTKENWTLLHHINTTEFLNYEGGKFSKSRGVGVFGNDAVQSGVPADVWRYYLLVNRPEQADTNFTWKDFGEKLNNELVANIGNLVNRTMVFAVNNFDGTAPSSKLNESDNEFLKAQNAKIGSITTKLERVKIKEALHEILAFSSNANKYFQDNAPWKLIKEDKVRCGSVINVLLNQVKDLAILLAPYVPETSERIFKQLGTETKKWNDLGKLSIGDGIKLGKPDILFRKLEPAELEKLSQNYSGTQFAGSKLSFTVSDSASKLGIKAAAAILEVKGISNKNSQLESLKSQKFKLEDSGYVELHKKVGAEEMSSIRWLHELASKTGQIPNINVLVDAYNIISLKHGISAGAHDVSKIKGNVRVDVYDGSEEFTELGSDKPKKMKSGEYAAIDDEKVICRLELKQCEQTKVGKNSKAVLLYYQGNSKHTQEQVNAALLEACKLIVKTCGGSYKLVYPAEAEDAEKQVHFKHLDIEVGEIISAQKHPNADKLLVEKVKLGDKEIQVVSGIAQFYTPEQIIGKRALFLRNLKPAALRGVQSEGMILVAESEDKKNIEIIFPESPVGSKVELQGEEQEPKTEITVDDYFKLKIEIKDGKLYSEGKQLVTETGEVLKTSLKDGKCY